MPIGIAKVHLLRMASAAEIDTINNSMTIFNLLW